MNDSKVRIKKYIPNNVTKEKWYIQNKIPLFPAKLLGTTTKSHKDRADAGIISPNVIYQFSFHILAVWIRGTHMKDKPATFNFDWGIDVKRSPA